jgi:glycine cleavage system aminomethyltransferase T
MGYCLYGNDIDQTTNPIEAGLGWITKTDKGDFIGINFKMKQEGQTETCRYDFRRKDFSKTWM